MAVSKKFRWTDENGETLEVEFGADGENVDVNGKALPGIISKLQTTTDKSLKYMGLCDSSKSINDYNTDDAFGIWQIGAGSTPADMPIARAANENVLLIISKAYGNGTHCKQELIYTARNIILNRTYGSAWNTWQFGATTTPNAKNGDKFVTFNAGSKGELAESEYSPDMFLRSDEENTSGAFKGLTVQCPATTSEDAAYKFTSGAYYDARTATNISWTPMVAAEYQGGVCQFVNKVECNPYWIRSTDNILLPDVFNNVAYYTSDETKFNFRIVIIAEIPNDTNTRTIISLFNGNTVVQRREAYGLRIVSKCGANGNNQVTSNFINITGLMAIAVEGSNSNGTITLSAMPISNDFSSYAMPTSTTVQLSSPAYIGKANPDGNFINNYSGNALNIYSMYIETASGTSNLSDAPVTETSSNTVATNIAVSMQKMLSLNSDNVASVRYVNNITDVISREIDNIRPPYFAVCDTACETTEKVISVPEITELYDGLRVTVHFTNGLKVDSNTLTVNSFNTYPILINSTDDMYSLCKNFEAGYTCDLIYYNEAFTMLVVGYADTAYVAMNAYCDNNGNSIEQTYAPLVSPSFTGMPTAPTAAAGTRTTQVATTAFVQNAINTVNSRIAAIGSVVDYADITIKVTKTALSGGQTNFKVTSATGVWAISATAVTTGFDTHSKDDEFDGCMGVNISVNTNKSVTITLDNTNMPTCDIDVSAGGSFTKRVYYNK